VSLLEKIFWAGVAVYLLWLTAIGIAANVKYWRAPKDERDDDLDMQTR
jgi:hypothetical protein